MHAYVRAVYNQCDIYGKLPECLARGSWYSIAFCVDLALYATAAASPGIEVSFSQFLSFFLLSLPASVCSDQSRARAATVIP